MTKHTKNTLKIIASSSYDKSKEKDLQNSPRGDADALIIEGKDGPLVYTLKDANEPYRQLVEHMSEGAAILDKDGVILYSNRRFSTMLGNRHLVGKSFFDFTSSAHHKRVTKLLGIVDAHLTAEIRLTSKAGKFIGVRASAMPMDFEGQRSIALVITALDEIAALKAALHKAEQNKSELSGVLEEARASERIYRAIGESINYGVWVCAPDGRNVYSSPSFLELVGMTQRECSDFGWGKVLHPDDAEKTVSAWQECVKTEGKWDVVHRYRGVDGKWHQILARGVPVRDDNGKIIYWAGINLDISALKEASEALQESEARFRAAQEASLDAFVIYTPIKNDDGKILDLKIIYANRKMAEHYNTEVEKLTGRMISDVLPIAKQPGGLIDRHGRVMESEKPQEYLLSFDVEGVTKYFRNLVVPFGPYVATTFRDVTDMIVGTNALAAAKAAAERAAIARTKFLATASHDLRQPVQTLVLLLSMLKSQEMSPSFKKVLAMAENALEGLKALMNSILNISRLDAGQITPEMMTVDVGELLERLSQEYVLIANDKGLRLRLVKRGLRIQTDPILLERTLRNLIENAIRYTNRGGILLGARRRGNDVRIDVIDTGIGIPTDKQPQIFEEFYQIDGAGHGQGLGLGLGLSIVKRLSSLLGAQVQIASYEHKGSRFSLSLPLDNSEPQQPAVRVETSKKNGGRILIIEDNVDVRTGLQLLVEGWGYETSTASSGEEALLLCSADAQYDIIMADHRLGRGITGTETVKKICEQVGKSIPSVIVTGDTTSAQILEIQATGFDVMYKPVGAAELRRKLSQLMQRSGKNLISGRA